MENATKALLIAAAILIAIVLISIGVFVLRQGQNAINSVNMSESEILAFNSKFESYLGTQRGTNVKALLDRIIISNREQGTDGAQVSVVGDITQAANATTASSVGTAKYYYVSVNKKDDSGLIKEIKIEDKSN